MFKKKIIGLMIFTMIVTMIFPDNFTISEVKANSPFAGGSGTEEDPYLIHSVHGLMAIGQNLNKHFALISDIDLSIIPDWSPIQGSFKGSLDGRGHSILNLKSTKGGLFDSIGIQLGTDRGPGKVKNLQIIGVEIIGNSRDVGVLARSIVGAIGGEKSVIENIKVRDVVLTKNEYYENPGGKIGGLAAFSSDVIFKNIDFDVGPGGYIEVRDGYSGHVGGLVGRGSLILEDSFVNVKIKGTNDYKDWYRGGITGEGTVDAKNVKVIVDMEGYRMGGITASGGINLENVDVSGNIKIYKKDNGAFSVGGLVGELKPGSHKIHKTGVSVNINNLDHTNPNSRVGGMIADRTLNGTFSVNIQESYFDGKIEGRTNYLYGLSSYITHISDSYVAGEFLNSGGSMTQALFLIGDSSPQIERVHVYPRVTYDNVYRRAMIPTCNSCYSLSGQYPDHGKAIELPAVLFNDKLSFSGWDFDNIWELKNGQYPTLRRAGVQGQIGYVEPKSEQLVVKEINKNETSVTIEWNDVGAASYTVLRDGAEIATVMDLSYTDIDLDPNTTYEYEVVANY